MSSYQFRKSHCGDKTVIRPSYLHNGISYTGKMSSLYWIGAMEVVSISDKMSYGKISQRLESVRPVSLWNSTVRCLKISDQLENFTHGCCTFDFLWDLMIRQFYTELNHPLASLEGTGRVHWNCLATFWMPSFTFEFIKLSKLLKNIFDEYFLVSSCVKVWVHQNLHYIHIYLKSHRLHCTVDMPMLNQSFPNVHYGQIRMSGGPYSIT